MIYVLLGKTCSGKTTTLKRLIELGHKALVSCTTRPKRPNEIDGKDYHFITDEEYRELKQSDLLVAPNTFISAYGTEWSYGIRVEDINFDEDCFVITEPKGYRDLVRKLGEQNVFGIYIDVSYEARAVRGLTRRDNIDELLRRLKSDEVDFEGIENEVDLVLYNLPSEEIVGIIRNITKGRRY